MAAYPPVSDDCPYQDDYTMTTSPPDPHAEKLTRRFSRSGLIEAVLALLCLANAVLAFAHGDSGAGALWLVATVCLVLAAMAVRRRWSRDHERRTDDG